MSLNTTKELNIKGKSMVCPKCGAKRGIKRWKGFSYDGSRRLVVDCWENECKHTDYYREVAKEGKLVKE